ncbi:hypothetical protein J9317_03290 [Metabacillus sp. KIGAM252]|uniref:Uncharacterized protein n=1 Tax=Metabacillus flavus TaxID=2823519 RepID=A0ABS5LAY2_9BACI|nr:hypothetical protein [Metabacillus flavus]MBS2967799.1 hypothetical protein [Metabacillus flavus]
MLQLLRKMHLKTAVFLGVVFYSLTLLIHVLIITGIIPFTWVNGGRSESFAAQLPISIFSIMICIFGGVFTLLAGEVRFNQYKRGITGICWFFVVLWSVGLILQLLGTPFEKMVCSFILVLGVISNLRMAIEKR